ncbi:hypothetical protein BGZ60DRAFT_529903 [Tricladium varicosporioides]|nr:hypothetical protein BGZ60DRAFT_529903 [Hymenoscyphus varicosporioides]
MQYLKTVVATMATLSIALAAPSSVAGIETRSNSGLYLCTGPGFSGHCIHFTRPFGQCANLDTDFAGKVNSVGPDQGNWCTMYRYELLLFLAGPNAWV